MTHDPLCPRIQHALEHWLSDCDSSECDAITCQCDLIAKIRADERAKCIDVLDAHHPRCTEPCDLCAEWSALREGLEALAGNP